MLVTESVCPYTARARAHQSNLQMMIQQMTHTAWTDWLCCTREWPIVFFPLRPFSFYLDSQETTYRWPNFNFCGESVGCLFALSQLLGSLTHCFLAIVGFLNRVAVVRADAAKSALFLVCVSSVTVVFFSKCHPGSYLYSFPSFHSERSILICHYAVWAHKWQSASTTALSIYHKYASNHHIGTI